MTPAAAFGARLHAAVAERGRLCVGIDPHAELLALWGLPDTADGAREFGLRIIDAASGRVPVVKPQVAFFERFGARGYAALEEVLAAARAGDLLVIADAKRGDIGSTMAAYAEAWLAPGAPLEADALTVSPYLGVLHETMAYAVEHGKGLFVLAATSNPEGAAVQTLAGGRAATVAADVARHVADFTAAEDADDWGSIGLVIGATIDLARHGFAQGARPTPILAPGFGHQGARLRDLDQIFGPFADAVLANESRGIAGGGAAEVAARIDERNSALGGTRG